MRTLRRKLRRDLAAQRTQFLAVAATVFLGITMFAASYDSFRNLEASYSQTATGFRFANFTVVGGDVATFATQAAAEPGVEAVDTRTVADLPVRLPGNRLLGRVVGLPADQRVNLLEILHGNPPGDGQVVVESHLADHYDLKPGASIDVLGPDGWETLTVAGVVASPEYIWPAKSRQEVLTSPDNFGVAFAPQSFAQRLTGDGRPNEAVVYYASGEENELLTDSLRSAAYDLGAIDAFTREEQASNSALEEDLRGFEELSLFFPILFLSAAGMAAYVMINRLVHAQRPQVGVLLANGYTRGQVLRHYLGYGLVPGVLGSIPGAIAGVLLARVVTGFYTDVISVPVTVIRFYPTTLFGAVALGVVATLVATIAPAVTASRLAPAESMRGTVPVGSGKPSIVERLFPPARRLPIRWRMGLRGIERNPRRTISTVLGVVLSLTLVLVSWGMLDTVQHLLDHQFVDVDRQDAKVYFAGLQTDVGSLTDIDGVAAAEPVFEAPVSVAVDDTRYSSALVALDPDTKMHGFFDSDGNQITLPADGVLAGAGLAEQTGAEPGDILTLEVPGAGTFEVPLAGYLDEPLGSLVYVSKSEAERLAGVPLPTTTALLSYEDGANPAAVRQLVLDSPGVAAFEDSKALFDTMRSFMGLFYGFVGVMLAFGAAMAFALIFNAMSVNIAERTREVGTLLAVGVEQRTISRLITAENLAVAAIGIPLGLAAGYVVSDAAMASFESDMFRFSLHMRPSTFVLSAAAILVVALLSQRPGLKAIRRMDVARIVKERSM